MQIENKKDTDKKISDDKTDREAERKEDKKLQEQRERRKFAEMIDESFRQAKDKLCDVERELLLVNKKMDSVEHDADEFIQLEFERDHLLDKKVIFERKYNE